MKNPIIIESLGPTALTAKILPSKEGIQLELLYTSDSTSRLLIRHTWGALTVLLVPEPQHTPMQLNTGFPAYGKSAWPHFTFMKDLH